MLQSVFMPLPARNLFNGNPETGVVIRSHRLILFLFIHGEFTAGKVAGE